MARSIYCICCLLLLSSFPLKGQEAKKTLGAYFNQLRSGKHPSIPRQLSLPENAKAILGSLSSYLSDTVTVVRAKAYTIAQLAGTSAQQASLRKDAVTKLVAGCKDRDSGNVGIALGYLTSFKKEDFTSAARDTVANLFKRKTPHYDALIRLTGFLELRQAQNDLRALSQQGTAPKQDRWAAMLALARMGDSYAVDNILGRIRKLPVNDDVVYQIFPDLVYTRQRATFNVLLQALNSDETNCESANAEVERKIPCAYRVMEMLAPAVQSYPLKVDESGDIDTNDYTEALKTVRDWFRANSNFVIRTDSY